MNWDTQTADKCELPKLIPDICERCRDYAYCHRPITLFNLGGYYDTKLIEPHEPNVVKAAWNIFGKSYEYRRRYNEYKAKRMRKHDESQLQFYFD